MSRMRTTPPPNESLGAALLWVFYGVVFALLGLAYGGKLGVYALLAGFGFGGIGWACVFGLFRTEFLVAVTDLKERTLGHQRSRYRR